MQVKIFRVVGLGSIKEIFEKKLIEEKKIVCFKMNVNFNCNKET